MRIALAFQRPDVEQFKAEIDGDQWERWEKYFTTEPQGWNAIQIAVQRITYFIAQAHSTKKLKERDFALRMSSPMSPKIEALRWEAMAISSQIREELLAREGVQLSLFEGE